MKVSDEVVFLEEAFDVLNQRFFESALSRPAITIQSTPGAHGHFTPYDAWDDSGLKLKEINLGAESLHRPVPNVIATLMHEMIHYWCHSQGMTPLLFARIALFMHISQEDLTINPVKL